MPELLECVYCGDEYDPEFSDAPRPRDWCSAEHQRLAFAPPDGEDDE